MTLSSHRVTTEGTQQKSRVKHIIVQGHDLRFMAKSRVTTKGTPKSIIKCPVELSCQRLMIS